ncbi:MAG: M20/M25/M40 family metallo-hydrolase [Planctomycetaceae bacterium]|nr:M20/M25/M40 family metallo-hydrolase [Planctomycetaceae bacterium]
MMRLLRVAIGAALFASAAPVRSADHAGALITTGELRTHVETLAADSLEGREAGRRGGQAAGAYILSELKRLAVRPAGDDGSFVQDFNGQYRNILALIAGSDERLAREIVVVGAHYDHVGYGNKANSYGPFGQIHNGADDNASGTAALLELIEAFADSEAKPKRTLLFAFWDAEEKGLLGSEHWISHPTVPNASIAFAFNFDMLGRLRDRNVEVYGVRTAAGLRRLVSERNTGTDLMLTFDWTQRDDSDHWSFYKRRIPYLMLHTGLHNEYHRPSDDVNLINVEGLRDVTTFCERTIAAVADSPSTWTFRSTCSSETNDTDKRLSTPQAQPPSRLGVRWDDAAGGRGEFLLTTVTNGSPAEAAGLHVGDRIIAVDGVAPADTAAFRRAVLSAVKEVGLTVTREELTREMPVRLAGDRVRVGMTWRLDDAEPGVVILRGVVVGSAAHAAGLQVGDRILKVTGRSFADDAAFREAFTAAEPSPELTVERQGRLWTTKIDLDAPAEPMP